MLEFEIVGLGPPSVDESARCIGTLTTNTSIMATCLQWVMWWLVAPFGGGFQVSRDVGPCWEGLRLTRSLHFARSPWSEGPMLHSNATLQASLKPHILSRLKRSDCLKPCHNCPQYHHTYAHCPVCLHICCRFLATCHDVSSFLGVPIFSSSSCKLWMLFCLSGSWWSLSTLIVAGLVTRSMLKWVCFDY